MESEKIELNVRTETPENASAFPVVDPSNISLVASTLLDWLGSFSNQVCEDVDFVKYVQGGRAIRLAQLYLDLLENLKLCDRSNAPVFHRERWHPVVLRYKRDWNKGEAGMLKLGVENEAVLGEQPAVSPSGEPSIYPEGTMFTVGGVDSKFSGIVTFPLDRIADVTTCIVDNIADPKTVLHRGVDFIVKDGSIAMNSKYDPFSPDSTFPKFEVLGDSDDEADVEVVLWCCDALFDRNFLYNHLGYAMRLPTGSTEVMKRVVNSVWNMVADGCTPRLLRSAICAMCGSPTIRDEEETIEAIYPAGTSLKDQIQIVTDKNVYDLLPNATLRNNVAIGATMKRFEPFDLCVRIYPYVVSPESVQGRTGGEFTADDFKNDIQSLDLPPALFADELESGFSVSWEKVPVKSFGTDRNGNPKLCFSLEGSDADFANFWSETAYRFEQAGRSMREILPDDEVSPLEFFLKNFVGPNTMFIVLDSDVVPADSPIRDPKFFDAIRRQIPSYVRAFFVERSSVGSGSGEEETGDQYDLSNVEAGNTNESTKLFAYESSADSIVLRYTGRHSPCCTDCVAGMRWVASCNER